MFNKDPIIIANKIYKYKLKKIEELVDLNLEKEKDNELLIDILTKIKNLITEDTDKYRLNEDEIQSLKVKIRSLEQEKEELNRLNNDFTEEENKYLNKIDNFKKEIDDLKKGIIPNNQNENNTKASIIEESKPDEENVNELKNKIKLLEDENNDLNTINAEFTEHENNYLIQIDNLESELFSLKYGEDIEEGQNDEEN